MRSKTRLIIALLLFALIAVGAGYVNYRLNAPKHKIERFMKSGLR